MDQEQTLQLRKLHRYADLVGEAVVRETADAENIELLEPAAPCFGPPPNEMPGRSWRDLRPGDPWGGKQQWAWLRGVISLPTHWRAPAIEVELQHEPHYLVTPADDNFPAGPEGQLFIDGARVGAIDRRHQRIRCGLEPGGVYDVTAVFFAARCACRHTLAAFRARWIDIATERLYYDMRVALELAAELPPSSPARLAVIDGVDAAARALDVREPGSAAFYESVPRAQERLDAAITGLTGPFDGPDVLAVGHAHLDLAWLWPISQSRHKATRTFATQCRLLEQYPDWVFVQSSPQAYAWVEEQAPELFARIRDLVAAGRWEAEGATWCEMDTNIPSGESLARQLLYGKRYFKEKLGVESRVLWLPDVFGYSAALPQLMRLVGVDLFVTSKISWNQYNRFPVDSFRWRGLDGSEVPAHFITTPTRNSSYLTYNAALTPWEVHGAWREYRQKSLRLPALMSFGHGDGGGGPTEEMLERGRRMATWPRVAELPLVQFDKVADLADRLAAVRDELPVWEGELYLEYHRGTYTSQAWIKRANRRNEGRLHDAEWLGAVAGLIGHEMDKPALDELWRTLLLLQFHDILPGSSVGEVYDEARTLHEQIASGADALTAAATDALCEAIDTSDGEEPAVLFNTLPFDRTEPVCLPGDNWRDDITVPAGGWIVVDLAALPEAAERPELAVSEDGLAMSNQFWRLRFDRQGRIVGLYDRRAERDVLPPGAAGNEWQVFEDRPLDNDAWDIDRFYQEHRLPDPRCTSCRVVERGPVRIAVEFRWEMPRTGQGPLSVITQRIVLYAASPRIDFETAADWHEHHQLLKVAFPVDVRATEAVYEVQFGHLRRPTHCNTSWDLARFEGCAQRFVDLGEHGYGVALINDCKYGYDVHDEVMRLTCIKCAQKPHGQADQGEHVFTYALLPHAGTFQEAGVIEAAACLNTPLRLQATEPGEGSLPSEFRLLRCNNPAVVADTLKPAEDGKGLVLRLYEAHGSHAAARLTFAFRIASANVVDLLERPAAGDDAIEVEDKTISVRLRPFQVLSLRLVP